MIDWDNVYDRIVDCRGIAFDTCHKIYVLMDDEQIIKMREYEYDPLYTIYDMGTDEMFSTVKHWWAESCALKFVYAVSTMPEGEDPNDGFEALIEQGARETDECYECGEEDCDGWECQRERCDNCGDDNIWEDGYCKDCWEDQQEEDED